MKNGNDELPDLQGFKFFNAPMRWVLEAKEPEVTTLGQLLKRFMEEWEWGKKPLGWARNPLAPDGTPFYGDVVDVVVAPYRKNFYVVIERAFNDLFGPHCVRVFYKSHQIKDDVVWVAICQICCMWHSDEKLQAAMIEAIDAGELYQSEKTAAEIVYK